jgi:metallo-beta-lactamase class B
MKHLLLGTVAALILSMPLAAQFPPAAIVTTNIPDVDRHIAAAKVAAGTEWQGLYTNACGDAVMLSQPAAPRGGGAGRAGGGGAARAGGGRGGRRAGGGGAPAGPPRDSWHADPVKVFDNAYYLGMTEYSVWAITTSQGIILVDAIYDYSIADEVTEGMKKIGLDPTQIKYVIVSHGHLDHAGGAKYLQDTYGAKLIMSAADYDLLDQQNPSWKPKRDMIATDGMKLTLGDTTLTLYLTPGHTLGTISTIIPLRDNGQPHVAAAWGGTRFNFGRNLEQLKMYADSAARFRDIADKAGADVIFSNHTEFDGSKQKLPAALARKAGQPNPYVIGKDAAKRYLTVANECAQAAVAGVMASATPAAQ